MGGVDDEAGVIFHFEALCERIWSHAGLGLWEGGVFGLDASVMVAGAGPFGGGGRFVWTKLSPAIRGTETSRSKFAISRSWIWICWGTIAAR